MIITFFSEYTFSQNNTGIINNGAKIIISENAIVNMDGNSAHYVNNTENNFDGRIYLNGKMKLEGNWINNSSTSDVFLNYGENAEIVFDSQDNQQEIGGETPTNFYNLSLNNDLSLTSDLHIFQILNLENSLLTLNDYDLFLDGFYSTVEGNFSADNMIVTNQTGKVQIFTDGFLYDFLIPIGTNNEIAEYSPVTVYLELPIDKSEGYLSVLVVDQKHPQNYSDNNFINRYWHIDFPVESTGDFYFDALCQYVDNDINGNENEIFGAFRNSTEWFVQDLVADNQIYVNGITTLNSDDYIEITGGEYDAFTNKIFDLEKAEIKVWSYENKIFAVSDKEIPNAKIVVFNLIGQKIIEEDFINNQVNEIVFEGNFNYYLLNIISDEVNFSEKLFVK